MKFEVSVPEVWIRTFVVEAETSGDALDKAETFIKEGVEDEGFDFSHYMGRELWGFTFGGKFNGDNE